MSFSRFRGPLNTLLCGFCVLNKRTLGMLIISIPERVAVHATSELLPKDQRLKNKLFICLFNGPLCAASVDSAAMSLNLGS